MNKIKQEELAEILNSYGIEGVFYDDAKQITPDSMIYIFSDKDGAKYVLLAADYLGGYEEFEMPYDFEFDDGFPYSQASFRAVKVFSYKEDAQKKADGYIDDKHYWTKASTGDVCMLFAVDELKIQDIKNMEEKYKQNVEELKELQLKMLENNEYQLRLLRDMIDSEFSFQRIIDYEGSVILYDLQKDISDGLALSFSLKNMLKNRQSIEGIERISSLLNCFYNITNDIYNKLDEYSLLK